MAISFVGSGTGNNTNSLSDATYAFTSLRDASNAQPTLQQNDLVIVAISKGHAGSLGSVVGSPPSGYTAVFGSVLFGNDSDDVSTQIYYKFMGATPDTSVNISTTGNSANTVTAVIHVLRGVDTTTPLDVTSTSANGTNGGNANPPSITPTTAGAWIYFAGACSSSLSAAAFTAFTTPASTSSTTNHFRNTNTTGATQYSQTAAGLKTDWSSGAFDPGALSTANTNAREAWTAATLALRPLAAPSWSSSTTASVAENATLSYTCAASNTTSYSIVGGADQAKFEISGTTLRWASNGTKDYEAPDDSDTNNTYVVTVRATGGGGTTDQTITVTVTNDTGDDGTPTTETLTTTGAGTWTVPTGVTSVQVECWGAGEPGYAGNGSRGGLGGCGGDYAKKNTFSVTPGASISYSIGASSSTQNTARTWFDSTATVCANGGVVQGQGFTNQNVGDVTRFGGAGAFDSGHLTGCGGGSSACPTAAGNAGGMPANNGVGGAGGTSAGTDSGAGGDGSDGTLAATVGAAPGGGGGGGYFGGGIVSGAAAGRGQIRLYYLAPVTAASDTTVSISYWC